MGYAGELRRHPTVTAIAADAAAAAIAATLAAEASAAAVAAAHHFLPPLTLTAAARSHTIVAVAAAIAAEAAAAAARRDDVDPDEHRAGRRGVHEEWRREQQLRRDRDHHPARDELHVHQALRASGLRSALSHQRSQRG